MSEPVPATAPDPAPEPSSGSASTPADGGFPLPPILRPDQNRSRPRGPPPVLVAQGAEARLYKTTFLLPSIPCALKYRPPKAYRHPALDARLTRHRILGEARNLVRCRREAASAVTEATARAGGGRRKQQEQLERRGPGQQRDRPAFTVPAVYAIDEVAGWLMMEWIEGRPVRAAINEYLAAGAGETAEGRAGGGDDAELVVLMGRIGLAVGGLHALGIVHGDLTTSNMILRPIADEEGEEARARVNNEGPDRARLLDGEIVLIDFGLASNSGADEDRAVDLYVLERAFASTHPRAEALFPKLLEAYKGSFKGADGVIRKLEDVRMRGRKRTMIG